MKVLSGTWGWRGDEQVFRVKAITANGKFIMLLCASARTADIEVAKQLAGVS